MSNKFSRIVAAGAAAVALSMLSLAPIPALAQTTNLPPRTHPRETRMSLKAHEMQSRLEQEIATAMLAGSFRFRKEARRARCFVASRAHAAGGAWHEPDASGKTHRNG